MKKIVIASLNPIKAEAVQNGFRRLFPGEAFEVDTCSVSSGVPEQPMSDLAARKGAINRAENAMNALPAGDYWVGIEGGCDYLGDDMVAFAWIAIRSEERMGSARTALFQLPKKVQELVESGLELGEADDQVFGRSNSKQSSGAVGLLTHEVVTRTTLYEQAVIMALIPFKNPDLYRN